MPEDNLDEKYMTPRQIADATGHTSTMRIFDEATNTWSAALYPLPSGEVRYEVTAATNDGIIYLPGGYNAASARTKTLFAFNATTLAWTQLADMPDVRTQHATIRTPGKIYVIGGQNNSGLVSTVLEYTIATDTWATRVDIPAARVQPFAAASPTALYVAGGSDSGGNAQSTTYSYPIAGPQYSAQYVFTFPGAAGDVPLPAVVGTNAAVSTTRTNGAATDFSIFDGEYTPAIIDSMYVWHDGSLIVMDNKILSKP